MFLFKKRIESGWLHSFISNVPRKICSKFFKVVSLFNYQGSYRKAFIFGTLRRFQEVVLSFVSSKYFITSCRACQHFFNFFFSRCFVRLMRTSYILPKISIFVNNFFQLFSTLQILSSIANFILIFFIKIILKQLPYI